MSGHLQLVLQSFGNENEYRRAVFTIYSFYAHASVQSSIGVILFTDRPDYFGSYLSSFAIRYVRLDANKISGMRGSIDFLHRMKIALIEEALNISDDDVFYVDSDTFFVDDPQPVIERVAPDTTFMHEYEYELESLQHRKLPAGKTFHDFYSLIANKNFTLADGSLMRISPSAISWNAGVIVLHRSHKALIPDVYALTEQFYPPTGNHASEQYAFSIILQLKTKVLACDTVVYHYWYRIKKEVVDKWLKRRLNDDWLALPLNERIETVKSWTREMPEYFDRDVLMIRDKAIQAFNEDDIKTGSYYTLKALFESPPNTNFLKDVAYHMRRLIKKKLYNI